MTIDFETIVDGVEVVIAAVAPVLDIAIPTAAPVVQIATKVI